MLRVFSQKTAGLIGIKFAAMLILHFAQNDGFRGCSHLDTNQWFT